MESKPSAAEPTSRWTLATILQTLLAVTVAAVALFFFWVVGQRILYPFELGWMEGAMVDHVHRVLSGQAIYTAPTYDHVAFLYHPGYFYVAALMSWFTGPGFLALRLTSVLATLGTCWFVYRLVQRDGTRLGGIVAAGFFLASFSLAGCYYDVGRIDPLFTCLLLAGIDRTRAAKTTGGLAVACGLFLLAWLTKQTALVILPCVVLGCAPGGVRRAAFFGFAVAATCGLAEWLLDALHDGWMGFFTLTVPRQHGVLPQFLTGYWTHDVLPCVGAVALLAVFLVRPGAPHPRVFHGAWIGGCILGSFLSRLHIGGSANVLMPMIAGLAVGCGLGLNRVPRAAGASLALGQIVVLFSLPFFRYPMPGIPSAEMRTASDRLLAELRASQAPVFLPWHGYLARMAGKPATAHAMAMDDVWRSGDARVQGMMDSSIRQRLTTAPYPMIYVDDRDHQQIMALAKQTSPTERVRVADGPSHALRQLVGGTILWPQAIFSKQ